MGWLTEGSDHEGYVVCVFADGMYGVSGKHRQITLMTAAGKTIWEDGTNPDSVAWRPPSEVVGWKVACSSEPFNKHVVLDPPWTRVWDPADEDFTGGRIYAGDPSSDDPEYVSEREDLEPLFIERWKQHLAPDLYLRKITSLHQEIEKVETQLNEAVTAARIEGLSWEKIGGALGITRQGARQRWDTPNARKGNRHVTSSVDSLRRGRRRSCSSNVHKCKTSPG